MKRLLALALFLLPCAAGAQATIPNYEFVTTAVDYAPASNTDPNAYSLQGSLGQTFTTVDPPTNTNQTLAYLGFGQTAVRYRYQGKALLQYWSADPASVPLSIRFYNSDGVLRNTEIVTQDSSGNYSADSWINPGFIGRMSIKAPHWLRRSVAVNAPVNFLAYPTAANALLLNGDAVDDNFIDSDDFGVLASSFFLGAGDPGFDARADFNGDGFVDSDDFGILASNFFVGGDE